MERHKVVKQRTSETENVNEEEKKKRNEKKKKRHKEGFKERQPIR